MNLNEIVFDDESGINMFGNNSIKSASISVYFRGIENEVIDQIRSHNIIIGCIAWLTNKKILVELAEPGKMVSIIVQKEDFLRPDCESGKGNKALKSLYSNIDKNRNNIMRFYFDGVLPKCSVTNWEEYSAIRCVGNHNKDKAPAFPRMHNKFCLFGKTDKSLDELWSNPINHNNFDMVITGSYNYTKNAGESLENIIEISDNNIIKAYYNEFSQIAAISEPLDWHSEWVSPQWRIGT